MKNFLFERYRASRPDLVRSFCNVRSAGHYLVSPGFREQPVCKNFLELFWCVSGGGYFGHGGKVVKLSSDEIFCYFPGDRHEISSGENTWDYYWLTVDCPDIPALIRTFALRREAVTAGPCPKELFSDTFRALSEVDADGAHLAAVRACEIFSCAANRITARPDDTTERFKNLVVECFADPEFSVAAAALRLGIHRSTLHRIFSWRCGVSPQEYLRAYRLQQAVNRLRSGESVKEIAAACGFSEQNYFTKVFRRRFGQPPAGFRASLLPGGGDRTLS